MSSDGQQLYDPYIPPKDTDPQDAYPPPPTIDSTHLPPPQAFPAQPIPDYQPVLAPQIAQSTNNTVVAVVNAAPTAQSTFTVQQSMPENYLVLNIITLLFCCFLFGLIGLLYSLQVESEWRRGSLYGAQNASRLAKNWGIAGIITGIFLSFFFAVVTVVGSIVHAS